MFIIAQVPFVDFRLLSKRKPDDCFFPNTFTKSNHKATYYRYLGEEKNRYSPSQLPVHERRFFDAHKILHVNKYIGGQHDLIYFPKLLFSRLYEEVYMFHFDIGIREGIEWRTNPDNLKKSVRNFVNYPLFSLNRKYDKEEEYYSLLELAEQIKQVYLYATKAKKAIENGSYVNNIIVGYPAVFITYDKSEAHFFGDARQIKLDNDITVRYDLVSSKHSFVNVWYIGKEDFPKYNQELRNLRIYLSKLHAYKESIRIMLEYLNCHVLDDLDMAKITTFFEYILSYMEKDKYYGYSNNDFWDIVFEVDRSYDGVSWDEYKRRIQAVKKEIAMKQNNNTVIIQDSTLNQSPIVAGSGEINFSMNQQESVDDNIKDFNKILKELLQDSQLTSEQLATLNDQVTNFMDYIKTESPQKGFASNLLKSLKSVFSCMLHNHDGIQKLMETGEKIVNLLK